MVVVAAVVIVIVVVVVVVVGRLIMNPIKLIHQGGNDIGGTVGNPMTCPMIKVHGMLLQEMNARRIQNDFSGNGNISWWEHGEIKSTL